MPDRDPETGRFEKGHNLPGPGRPSLYDASMNEAAEKLALLGMTDEEMAKFFGIDTSTFYEWMKTYPAFSEAVYAGKDIADANVASSLYKRATGEHVLIEAVRKGKDGDHQVVKFRQFIPADPGAALNWLKNRQPEKWRDKKEVEHSGGIDLTGDAADAKAKLAQRLKS